MKTRAGRIVDALSATCIGMKDILDTPQFNSYTLIVNMDRNGNPRVTFRAESRGYGEKE